MYVLVSANIINIVFNYIFVMILGMGSDGVAYGTVIAQYSGLFLAIFLLWKHFSDLFSFWTRRAMLQWDRFREFLMVNKDIFIRTMCLVIVFSFFTASSASADQGSEGRETILAVNSLLMQFFMFFSFLIDGFAHAAEALTGRYIGEKDREALRRSIRILFYWGGGIAASFTFLYAGAGGFIFRLLTNNPEVIANAQPYFFWVIMIPVLSFAAFIWDGIFIGATAGKQMRNAMLISTLLFFPTYFLLYRSMGNHGLWLAFVIFMAARGISMSMMTKGAIYTKV